MSGSAPENQQANLYWMQGNNLVPNVPGPSGSSQNNQQGNGLYWMQGANSVPGPSGRPQVPPVTTAPTTYGAQPYQAPAPAPSDSAEKPRTQPVIAPTAYDRLVNARIEPKANNGTQNKWVIFTYYEYDMRVGDFDGDQQLLVIDGFCDSSSATRFCLGAFGTVNRKEKVIQVRRQIGCGCHIQRFRNEVTVTNRSEASIFVSCPMQMEAHGYPADTVKKLKKVTVTNRSEASIFVSCPMQMEAHGYPADTVKKLKKGEALMIFDKASFEKTMRKCLEAGEKREFYEFENMARVRIAFGKGFGEGFNRKTVTETPCWVEVRFIDIMRDIDKELMKLFQAEESDESVSSRS
uniref:MH2 domain-containing protein n=1 Tax=Steinernema glaseri TaxID=37863 RepID=A0A1I7ZRW6_9BILA